ncbi:hypothetical protein AVANS14531_01490 [Campylobacter sp. Cr9]|uniref:hypothetical protein n=1 Tax=Campylobacter sp. Cr9 TaxID=2735728 RepID=UPI0030155006|nr:hypothetical protein [Campylobacter sp. Cr9]
MNKKIVFSLAVLSAFSYVSGVYIDDDITCKDNKNSNFNQCAKIRWQFKLGNPNSQDHIANFDSCLKAYDPNTGDERGRNSFDKCTRLGKAHDNFYVQCINQRGVPLAERSEDFHRINLLSDKFKAKYDALRVCSIQHFDARKYDICKYFESARGDCGKNDFVKLYQNLVEKTLNNNPSDYCKGVLKQELDDVKLYREKGIKRSIVDYPVYFPYSLPDIIQIRKNNIQNFEVEAKFNVRTEKKIIQDYYKEFVTDTTGRIEVESNAAKTYTRTLIYFLEQPDVEWQVENFAKYIVGNDAAHNWSKGLGWLDWGSHDGKVVDSDNNKIIQIDGRTFNGAQGAGNVYEHFLNYRSKYLDNNEELRNKIYEYLFLKNSRVRPITSNYFRDYPENYREGGNLGGPSKCYNYDLQQFKSEYSRASYFDYQNLNDFVFNSGAPEFQPKKYTFSIHKSFDNTKGIFEEGKNTKFSINVRPSFDNTSPFYDNNPTGNEGGIYNSIKLKFYADADSLFITDIANQDNRNLSKPLKVNDLDNVYIALKNHGDSIPVRNAGTKYYLSQFTMSKRQISDSDGAVDGKLINIENTDPIELQIQEGINGLGLKFDQNAFYKLVGISKKEIEDGKTYEITFKIKTIIDDNGIYKRPLFEEDSNRIIKGKQLGEVKIILGHGQMPGLSFGTAYANVNNGKVVDGNRIASNVEIANQIYTRTNNQSIYLGIKKANVPTLYRQYIRFLDANNNPLKVKVYGVNGKLLDKNSECQGYFPLENKMVLELGKLSVGQNYKLSYEAAEYDTIDEACNILGQRYSNEFTIRPEKIEYKVAGKDEFQKNTGKVDSNYTDNNVIFTSNMKDDKFGIGIAELRVTYADTTKGVKTFNLEDINTNLLNKVTNTTTSFVDFDKTKGDFAIKTIFPMVTDAKILLAENKFTHEDLKNGLCNNNDRALYKDEANKIELDGKINCQTPGNEISVKFIANQSFSLEKDTIGNDIKASVTNTNFINYVPFSDLDNERLRIPLQIANTNNGSYFYKKYDSDSVKAELNITYAEEPKDLKKVIINATSDLDVKVISQNQFELSGLNRKFDDKLAALDITNKLSTYNEGDFDAKNFAKLEYKIGYPKTSSGKANLEKEFVISNADSKITFTSGSEEPKNNILDRPYRFAYTGLFFKDIRVNNKSANGYNIESGNAGLLKYVENKGFKPLEGHYINNFNTLYNSAISSFNLISDYSRSSLAGNKYEIPNNLKHNQYVKDTIRFDIKDSAYKYLDSFSTFTIEFIK